MFSDKIASLICKHCLTRSMTYNFNEEYLGMTPGSGIGHSRMNYTIVIFCKTCDIILLEKRNLYGETSQQLYDKTITALEEIDAR